MKVEIAATADVEEIYQLYDEARADLRAKGIFQWPDDYPSVQTVQDDIDLGELYLLRLEEETVGAVCLNQRQDEQYKTVDWLFDDQKVMVVHRLVVTPALQRHGLAKILMTFAEGKAVEEAYTSIRLDAYTGHERTRRFYERRGYIVRGEVMFPKREMSFWCFEREVKTSLL